MKQKKGIAQKRLKMCGSCIYRTGELTPFEHSHECHEHLLGPNQSSPDVLCFGSKGDGERINTPTPNAWVYTGRFKRGFMETAIRKILERKKASSFFPPFVDKDPVKAD